MTGICTLNSCSHVLVVPQRRVDRFKDLSTEEVSDLYLSGTNR